MASISIFKLQPQIYDILSYLAFFCIMVMLQYYIFNIIDDKVKFYLTYT